MIRLLSYNIFFGKQLEKILAWMGKIEKRKGIFDMICFQEFPSDQISAFLKHRGGKADHRFAPSIYAASRVFGQLTVCNTEKLRFIKTTELPLGTSRIEKNVSRIFRRSTKRKSLLTMIKINNAREILIANTHLTSVSFNKHRRGQLEKVLREIDKVESALLVGDLNYTSAFPRFQLRRLMRKHHLEDATRKLKTHRLLFLKHQLDYIFAKKVYVTNVQTERLNFSDHYPLMAEFEFEQ